MFCVPRLTRARVQPVAEKGKLPHHKFNVFGQLNSKLEFPNRSSNRLQPIQRFILISQLDKHRSTELPESKTTGTHIKNTLIDDDREHGFIRWSRLYCFKLGVIAENWLFTWFWCVVSVTSSNRVCVHLRGGYSKEKEPIQSVLSVSFPGVYFDTVLSKYYNKNGLYFEADLQFLYIFGGIYR